MMTAGEIFADEEEENVNVHAMTRRLLTGVMCAGLLVATMGAATLAQTPVAGHRRARRQPPSRGRTSR